MSAPDSDMAERHSRILTALSELGVGLASNLQALALAAEDDETAAKLAASFHQVARSVRQTLHLEAKLERDRKAAEREDREDAARERQAAVDARRNRVRIALEREIWNEFRGFDAENACTTLDDLLAEAMLDHDFLDRDLETQIAELRARLPLAGVSYADRLARLAADDERDDDEEDDDEEDEDEDAEPLWRSSG